MDPNNYRNQLLMNLGSLITQYVPPQKETTAPTANNTQKSSQLMSILRSPHTTVNRINFDVTNWLGETSSISEKFKKNIGSSDFSLQIVSKGQETKQESLFLLEAPAATANFSKILLPQAVIDSIKARQSIEVKTLQDWFEKSATGYKVRSAPAINSATFTSAIAFLPIDVQRQQAEFVPILSTPAHKAYLFFTWSSNGLQSGFSAVNFETVKNFEIQDSVKKDQQHNWACLPIPENLMQELQKQADDGLKRHLNGNCVNIAIVEMVQENSSSSYPTKTSETSKSHLRESRQKLFSRNESGYEEEDTTQNTFQGIMGSGNKENHEFVQSNYMGYYTIGKSMFLQLGGVTINTQNLVSNPFLNEGDINEYVEKVQQTIRVVRTSMEESALTFR